MILVIIICGILYLFMIYGVVYLYYTYHKDYEELENRLLQLEKRLSKKVYNVISKEELEDLRERWENEYFNWINKPEHVVIDNLPGGKIGIKVKKNNTNKEGEDNMACKKGRGGRKK